MGSWELVLPVGGGGGGWGGLVFSQQYLETVQEQRFVLWCLEVLFLKLVIGKVPE